jgi:hypothetical protein
MSFVQPHLDDRVVVESGADRRAEHLGTRSSYIHLLEAFTAAVRDGAPLPTVADDAVATIAAGTEPRGGT